MTDGRTSEETATVGLTGYGTYVPDEVVTGEEIASSMGISRSTFHEHLRAAQRKLCAEFFDDAG